MSFLIFGCPWILILVRYHSPVFWSKSRKRPLCSDIRLIETRENIVAIVWFELRIEILLRVYFIGERMKTIAIISIIVNQFNGHFIRTDLQQVAMKNDLAISEVAAHFSGHCFIVDD